MDQLWPEIRGVLEIILNLSYIISAYNMGYRNLGYMGILYLKVFSYELEVFSNTSAKLTW